MEEILSHDQFILELALVIYCTTKDSCGEAFTGSRKSAMRTRTGMKDAKNLTLQDPSSSSIGCGLSRADELQVLLLVRVTGNVSVMSCQNSSKHRNRQSRPRTGYQSPRHHRKTSFAAL